MKKNKAKVVNFSMYSGYNFTKELNKDKEVLKTEKGKKKPKRKSPPKNTKKKKENFKKNGGNKWKIFLLLLFVLALVLFCLYTPLFNIEEIEVEGVNKEVKKEEVEVALNEAIQQVKNDEFKENDTNIINSKYTEQEIINMSEIVIGNNIFKENLKKAKEKIKNGSYVKEVKIARKFPNKILIKITERKIKAYINYVGTYMCIDETGFVVDTVMKQNKNEDIIIVEGINPMDISKGFQVGEILSADDPIKLQRVIELLSLIEKKEIEFKIQKIDVSDKNEVTITIENGNKQVILGDMTDINTKCIYLKEILEKQVGKKGTIYMNSNNGKLEPIFAERIGG